MAKGEVMMKRKVDQSVNYRLREIREELHLSREAMAEQIDISTHFLAEIETGRKGLSAQTIQRACQRLSISADYLLLGKREKEGESIIEEMLSNLEAPYREMAKEILKNFILAVSLAKEEGSGAHL